MFFQILNNGYLDQWIIMLSLVKCQVTQDSRFSWSFSFYWYYIFLGFWMDQGDSGQRSKPVGLIN